MAAQRPPGNTPPLETLDDADLIDETAPPQRSPLRGVLPFGPAAPRSPAASPPPAPAPPPPPRSGEETAPAERSPLAAALPFRHAKPASSTVAIPMPTPEDLRRLSAGAPPQKPATGPRGPLSAADRARMEQAKTVAFSAMPPGFGVQEHGQSTPPANSLSPAPHTQPSFQPSPVPAGGGPVAAGSTGHFGLSIEQYAALCAEVATQPDTAETTFAKYGLASRKDRLTADAAWQDRLRADNTLMARWQSLYLHYHEHFSRTAKR